MRPGGLRFDRDGYAIMVDARTPNIAVSRVAFPRLMPPGPSPLPVGGSASQLTDWVTDWSSLIEHDRVWSDALLGR